MDPSAAEWEDDFESNRLRPEWLWINQDPSHWNVTDRPHLTITTQSGGVLLESNNAKNLLLRPVLKGDFTIQTLVHFNPVRNFHFAGLLIFQDLDNLLALGRAYCEIFNETLCIGNAIYFDHEEEGVWVKPNYTTPLSPQDIAHLRIQKRGDEYSGFFSNNGEDWIKIGTHKFDSSRAPIKVGLIADDGDTGAPEIDADFEYFLLRTTGESTLPIADIWAGIDNLDDSYQTIRFREVGGNRIMVDYYDDGASYCGVDENNNPIYPLRARGTATPIVEDIYTYEVHLSGSCPHKGPYLNTTVMYYYDPMEDTLTDQFKNFYKRK